MEIDRISPDENSRYISWSEIPHQNRTGRPSRLKMNDSLVDSFVLEAASKKYIAGNEGAVRHSRATPIFEKEKTRRD